MIESVQDIRGHLYFGGRPHRVPIISLVLGMLIVGVSIGVIVGSG